MRLSIQHWAIIAVNALVLFIFGAFYIRARNYEFLLYIGVILFFAIVILTTMRTVRYSLALLWGLTVWAALHMAGGGVRVGEGVLYQAMLMPLGHLLPVTSLGELPILRFDQFVHIVGFAVATLLVWELLRPIVHRRGWVRIGIVVVMAGLGLGALNEIVEFLAVLIMPETGVGGYLNTGLDLVANLVGAIIAWALIWWRERSAGPALALEQ